MPKRRVPPNEPSDPAIRALIEKVQSLFAVRCAVFKIDPDSKDFWRLMSCAFALEHLLAECRPPAKAKKTKPERWTPSEKKKFLESVRKMVAGGVTIEDAVKALTKRFPGKKNSLVTRYYEAKKWERGARRDAIAEILLRNSGVYRPSPTGGGE